MTLLPSAPALLAFGAASLVLAVTPGPGVLYIVSRTLAQGRAAGIGSAAGVACGNFLNAVGASLGLAALLAVSSVAFTIVKLSGAAYLIWLGWKMLRTPSAAAALADKLALAPVGRLFRDGLLVAMLNPKTALFFAAFLPQFMPSAIADAALPASHALQAMALGGLFVLIAACTDCAYVLLAATVGAALRGAGNVQRWAGWFGRTGGVALIGLGVASAFAGRPAAR